MKKFDYVGFLSNIIAVVLGIIITFSIQSLIDKKNERKSINSALELVKDELKSCLNDLNSCAEYMDLEGAAAAYVFYHKDELKSCPQDSITLYGQTILTHMVLTNSQDALELLKSSSLFQSIGDNNLSLQIIRAYSQCTALEHVFNDHETWKGEQISSILEAKTKADPTFTDRMSLTELLNEKDGLSYLSILKGHNGDSINAGISDIESAIKSIEEYLQKK